MKLSRHFLGTSLVVATALTLNACYIAGSSAITRGGGLL
jgi:hypothetical protein